MDIEDFTDLELTEELEYRGYAVYEEEIEEVIRRTYMMSVGTI